MISDDEGEIRAGTQTIAWPWYVRCLAVMSVVSILAGPVGFFVLGGVGAFLTARRGPGLDAGIAFAAALACPLGCAMFRWWFRRWGQRRWPQPEPVAPSEGGL